jgi:intracellular sulfur oxidation DsrE/DsrF family protein
MPKPKYCRPLSAVSAALLLALTLPAQAIETSKVGAGKTATVEQNRIVIQVNEDDSKKWNAVLANIRNIQAELGSKNVSIAIVAISYGIGMLTLDSLTANGVQDAIATGVEFIACGNSMQAQKISQDDLIAGVGMAKAGYVELMRRQQQGWVYLRP